MGTHTRQSSQYNSSSGKGFGETRNNVALKQNKDLRTCMIWVSSFNASGIIRKHCKVRVQGPDSI